MTSPAGENHPWPWRTVHDVASVTKGRVSGESTGRCAGICTDTRALIAGQVFVALEGEQFDGHDFVGAAAERNAACAVVHRKVETSHLPLVEVEDTLAALGRLGRCHREQFDIPVHAVSGSVGKTTTKTFIASILATEMDVLAAPASHNNDIGVPLALLELRKHHSCVVLEFAMRGPGEIERLCRLAQPCTGVITCIGTSHLGRLGSLEAICDAKRELLRGLPADGLAVTPAETPLRDRLLDGCPAETVTFGATEKADFAALDVRPAASGVEFRLRTPDSQVGVSLPYPGAHNALNAAAAAAVAVNAGIGLESVALGLANARLPSHRMRVVSATGEITVIDDCYNASPESMSAALAALQSWKTRGRRIAVLGDMLELGEAAPSLHRQVGAQVVGAGVQVLITVGELGRFIGEGAMEIAASGHLDLTHAATAADALEQARKLLRPHDVVLVKASRAIGLETVVEGLQDG